MTFDLAISRFVTDWHHQLCTLGLYSALDQCASYANATNADAPPVAPRPPPCCIISYVDDFTKNAGFLADDVMLDDIAAAGLAAQATEVIGSFSTRNREKPRPLLTAHLHPHAGYDTSSTPLGTYYSYHPEKHLGATHHLTLQ